MTEIGKKVKVIDEKNMQIERLYRSFFFSPRALERCEKKERFMAFFTFRRSFDDDDDDALVSMFQLRGGN